MQVPDKSFIVTGGGSGLGQAAARRLVDAGAHVLIADLDEVAGQATVAALGPRAWFVRTDVSDAASGTAAVAAAVERFGALDGLVNCAGIAPAGKVLGRDGPQPLDRFAHVLQVNLLGSFNMLRLAAQAMAGNAPGPDGERGVIVNTASVAAFDGQVGQAAYAASKGGVVGMTLPIARELARHGIRVMTIAPGIMATPLLRAMPQEVQDALDRSVPFPARMGDPDEFARLVLHIVDNAYLNGEVIRLDGAIRMAPR